MDHYRFPRHRGRVDNPDFVSQELNPSCGDAVCLSGRFEGDALIAVAFEGTGCVISQAAASLLMQACHGKPRAYLASLTKELMVELVGIELGPTRLKCALLPLQALHQGLAMYQKGASAP